VVRKLGSTSVYAEAVNASEIVDRLTTLSAAMQSRPHELDAAISEVEQAHKMVRESRVSLGVEQQRSFDALARGFFSESAIADLTRIALGMVGDAQRIVSHFNDLINTIAQTRHEALRTIALLRAALPTDVVELSCLSWNVTS